MKTSTKCNKRLIARVQALVDDDARITIQEISEVLYTSSGSVSNVSSDELRYNKVSARWVLHSSTKENKRDRVVYSKSLLQIYDNCDPRCLHGFLLVMKHGCTAMNLRSTQNRAWVPKGENSPQIAKRNRSRKKVLCTIFFYSSGSVLHRTTWRGEESSTGKYYRQLSLAKVNRFHVRVRQSAGMRGGIKLVHDSAHLLTSTGSWKTIIIIIIIIMEIYAAPKLSK